MKKEQAENPELGYYFTNENILVFSEPVLLDELVQQLLVNLAVTVGIGHIVQTRKHYLEKHKEYHIRKFNPYISVLHFRINFNGKMHIAMAVTKSGIESPRPTHAKNPGIFVLLVTPHNRPDLLYRVLPAIRQMSEDVVLIKNVLDESNTTSIWEQINKQNFQLSPYVMAQDVMVPPRNAVQDTDNLEKAIDLLIMYQCRCLPVVDRENELIGEVSLEELLKICFPRHILWMDDITPILQFETFRNILNNESSTWLTEIMNYRVATVQWDDPAVKAAIGMTKLSTEHVYVLRNRTLVGLVTIKNLANMILRK
ncbi:CBS domain-containing protein [Gaoshiqia sediminis]|uniref:CBS domain-containing protein n=1 Tax=Gaoshiqia sediminis TaxID=2986998 RepID=A0AA42C6W1_9BACT|nr:CBS domain-containing protein [Gaoshiqia sediminis]MCW0484353.1 CBS domain-containing protein [Gaoshiqia sediminis]